MESDERIVEQCQQGRSSGFSLLLLAYQERVYRRAFSFVRQRDDALDITQEVFLKEIARVMDLPLGTVKTYRFRARRTLRTELTARGGWA